MSFWRSHFRSHESEVPGSLAIWELGLPPSRAGSIARWRNSGGYAEGMKTPLPENASSPSESVCGLIRSGSVALFLDMTAHACHDGFLICAATDVVRPGAFRFRSMTAKTVADNANPTTTIAPAP
jgi:hypothetical protein